MQHLKSHQISDPTCSNRLQTHRPHPPRASPRPVSVSVSQIRPAFSSAWSPCVGLQCMSVWMVPAWAHCALCGPAMCPLCARIMWVCGGGKTRRGQGHEGSIWLHVSTQANWHRPARLLSLTHKHSHAEFGLAPVPHGVDKGSLAEGGGHGERQMCATCETAVIKALSSVVIWTT